MNLLSVTEGFLLRDQRLGGVHSVLHGRSLVSGHYSLCLRGFLSFRIEEV